VRVWVDNGGEAIPSELRSARCKYGAEHGLGKGLDDPKKVLHSEP
jgi:hypothetical protein